jgi:hypothetical protein
MAFVRHLQVAKATYEATLLIRPDKPVTLRHGARVILAMPET